MQSKVQALFFVLFVLLFIARAAIPRNVHIAGKHFVDRLQTSQLYWGPNVVVKGPPYLPNVAGNSVCNDIVTILLRTR